MNNKFNNIFKNKNVLVTGDTGFKGSWLCLWLSELGANVTGYALAPNTQPNMFDTINLKDRIKHVTADIRDEEALNRTLEECQPEFVFHLAAQPLVRYSYAHPKLTYETNVMGTINLLEGIKKTDSVKVMVNVTSDKCYENKEWEYGYREIDPMGGYDPYSNSKGVSELITAAYRNSFFNPKQYGQFHNVALSSGRAGNVIGGGDWSMDRLIPDCIRALTQNEEIVIRNPIATRPWQFVLEPLSGYLHLASKMYEDGIKYSEGWNFGPNDDSVLKVHEVTAEVVSLWGCGSLKVEPDSSRHEAGLLKLDISKAKQKLGWKPVYDAKEAVKETVDWYKGYYSKQNILEYSLIQLNRYVNTAEELDINWSSEHEKLYT